MEAYSEPGFTEPDNSRLFFYGLLFGAALGAARLAWLACGGDEAQICQAPTVTHTYRPDAGERAVAREK